MRRPKPISVSFGSTTLTASSGGGSSAIAGGTLTVTPPNTTLPSGATGELEVCPNERRACPWRTIAVFNAVIVRQRNALRGLRSWERLVAPTQRLERDMADPVTAKNTHDDVPQEKKIAELHKLIDGIAIAMLTTRDASGRLISRPMATQSHDDVADVWFMTSIETHKVEELEANPQVNVAYLGGSKEWVSISGTAQLHQDRSKIRKLYKPDWKAWFDDRGGAYDGGPDDPRIALIEIDADHVTYFKVDQPRPIVLFEIARAALTKSTPNLGAIRHIDP